MTVQIAIRLDDDLVRFLDEQTRDGHAASRAAVVRKALRRLMRDEAHRHDVEIYAREGVNPEVTAMVEHLAAHPVTLDD